MENTAKRITKTQKYEDIIAMLSGNPAQHIDTDGAVEFLKSEIALLAKKNSSDNKKPTATQEANAKYKALILEFLAVQESGKTCTEIAKGVPELGDFNNQKVAALMRQLVEAGQATKATVKGKSVFTVAWESPRGGSLPPRPIRERGWKCVERVRTAQPHYDGPQGIWAGSPWYYGLW